MWHSLAYEQAAFASPSFPTVGSDSLSVDSDFTLRAEESIYTSPYSTGISRDLCTG
jgi:hypothetical protein